MTIAESLLSISTYPIPDATVEKICIERGITHTADFLAATAGTEAYQLATADVYLFLYTAPNLKEQQVSFSYSERNDFLSIANTIYGRYDDDKFSAIRYGFQGESYNGN